MEYGRQRARAKDLFKMAVDSLSGANKASDKSILDKTREIIRDTFRGDVGAKLATIIANGVQLQHNEYNDSIQTTRATPPSQSSSSSSSSSSGATRLGKEAVMDAALKEVKGRLEPTLKKARLYDRSV